MFHAQHEPGLQALLQLAEINRDTALAGWRRARGDDMVRFQTEYNAYQGVIDTITKRPYEFDGE